MRTLRLIALAAYCLLALANTANAIENLRISVQCPDVALAWRSLEGETFLVQHRATLDTNSVWVTLTNALPATVGSNWTWFVHSNQVVCTTNGGSGGGGGSEPPSPTSLPLHAETELAGTAFPIGEAAQNFLAGRRILPPYVWDLKQRPPHPWELEDRPPYPWEPGASNPTARGSGWGPGDGIEADGPLDSGGETSSVAGFYRVVRTGPSLWGLTNGMTLSGTVTFPIEFGGTNAAAVQAFMLYANDLPVPSAQVETNATGGWALVWDTASMRNGTYDVHLRASFVISDFEMDASLPGTTRTVTIDNGIMFPQPNLNLFGEALWFYFETRETNFYYAIDLFVETNTYLGSFEYYMPGNVESFLWYPANDGFTNNEFRCEFYVQGAAPGSPVVMNTNRWYGREAPFNDPRHMVVAFAPPTGNLTHTVKAEAMVRQGVLDILDGAYTFCPGNNPWGTALQLTASTKPDILGYFNDPAYRYVYIFAHGDQFSFGPHNNPPAMISEREIRRVTTNILSTVRPIACHPFKFVWIDGCETAQGAMCEAFGIPSGQYYNAYFNLVNKRSRAFLGAYEKFGISYNVMDTRRAEMLSRFWNYWLQNYELWQCCTNAAAYTPEPLKSWRIHGATNLTIQTF